MYTATQLPTNNRPGNILIETFRTFREWRTEIRIISKQQGAHMTI